MNDVEVSSAQLVLKPLLNGALECQKRRICVILFVFVQSRLGRLKDGSQVSAPGPNSWAVDKLGRDQSTATRIHRPLRNRIAVARMSRQGDVKTIQTTQGPAQLVGGLRLGGTEWIAIVNHEKNLDGLPRETIGGHH